MVMVLTITMTRFSINCVGVVHKQTTKQTSQKDVTKLKCSVPILYGCYKTFLYDVSLNAKSLNVANNYSDSGTIVFQVSFN